MNFSSQSVEKDHARRGRDRRGARKLLPLVLASVWTAGYHAFSSEMAFTDGVCFIL